MNRTRFGVIGSGMFVCGRNTAGHGTILPALASAFRDNLIEAPTIFVRNRESAAALAEDCARLSQRLGWKLPIHTRITKTADDLIRAFRDEPPFDGALIAVPDFAHKEYGLACIEAAVPIQMVKPLAPTVAECLDLVRAAESRKIHAVVEYHKRHDLMNRKLREAWIDQKIGIWLHGMVEYSQQRRMPLEVFRAWSASTNIFHYLGVHYLDVVRYATAGIPLRAMATAQYGVLRQAGLETPDTIQAIVEFRLPNQSQPFTLILHTGWNDPNNTAAISYQRIQIVGTLGRINSDQRDRGHQQITANHGIEDINCYFTQPFPEADGTMRFRGYGIDSVQEFIQDANLLAQGSTTYENLQQGRSTFREATFASAIAEAVDQSLMSGSIWVDVDTRWANSTCASLT